jgi:hypothetical protein
MLLCCYAVDDVLIKLHMANRAVVAPDISVLLRLAGLDMLDPDVSLRSPFHQSAVKLFRAVVDPNDTRVAAPFDNAVRAADYPLRPEARNLLRPRALRGRSLPARSGDWRESSPRDCFLTRRTLRPGDGRAIFAESLFEQTGLQGEIGIQSLQPSALSSGDVIRLIIDAPMLQYFDRSF